MSLASKILLVEDDPMQVAMYEVELSNHGWQVSSAKNGQTALEMIKKELPDLVLLDLLLPDLDGKEVLKQIKSNPFSKDLKVMILSNYKKAGLAEECKALGALDFWLKSNYLPKEIAEKVGEILSIN